LKLESYTSFCYCVINNVISSDALFWIQAEIMDKWGPSVKLIGVGCYIVACIIGGVLGGLWVDRTFKTEPIFLLIGLIFGLVAAFWGVYQMLKPMMGDNKRDRRK
jgi:hypothetical protein